MQQLDRAVAILRRYQRLILRPVSWSQEPAVSNFRINAGIDPCDLARIARVTCDQVDGTRSLFALPNSSPTRQTSNVYHAIYVIGHAGHPPKGFCPFRARLPGPLLFLIPANS